MILKIGAISWLMDAPGLYFKGDINRLHTYIRAFVLTSNKRAFLISIEDGWNARENWV